MRDEMISVVLLTGLVIEAVFDLKKREIWLPVAAGEIPVLLAMNYWKGNGGIWLWMASLGIGMLFYMVSRITKGQLGTGDSVLFAMTGAGLGMTDNLILLYLTFACTFAAAAVLWMWKRVGRNYRLPLAPFVLASYCIMYIFS